MKCKPYRSSTCKSFAPNIKELLYYSKQNTYKSETLHIVLNMSKHHKRIVEFKLRLLEEPGEKTFVVPHVSPSTTLFELIILTAITSTSVMVSQFISESTY